MRNTADTIAAVATPRGEGGIAVVRISGPDSLEIIRKLFRPAKTPFVPNMMYYGHIFDTTGREVDEVMCVYFRAPKSYTREDVIEIHCHGGSFVTGRVLEACVSAGARPAEKGEFTYRAFANGRIDLSKAEAVMQLIGASNEMAARGALRQMKGGVSSRIGRCREKLLETVTLIDAAADFPDEIDEEVTFARVQAEAKAVYEQLSKSADPRYAHLVSDGARVVIAGKPNVGKSSILNALLCCDRAIVSDIAGTTRDIVSESVNLDGVRLTLTDTAGIRDTSDTVESIGVNRAKDALATADCVVLVMDSSRAPDEEDAALLADRDDRYIVVSNKNDIAENDIPCDIKVSAKDGSGLDALTELIKRKCDPGEDDDKLMSLRHINCAKNAMDALDGIINAPDGTYLDLLREDAVRALACLGEITGEDMSESAIDGIFERFCVGK